MPASDLFTIIIPNWNGLQHLEICLNALRQQTYPHVEIIIVDNASTDGSQAFIRERYPEVKLLELPTNQGFTGACNTGLRAGQGTYLALLNNDTEVTPTWTAAVVDAFERYPEAGIVASKMLLFDRRDHLHTAGDFYGVDGWPGNIGAWQTDHGQFDREDYVFSACGGSSVYRRQLLDEVGLLDDDFFFSMEDIDLGWRAQLAGWKCIYTPTAVLYHRLSATGGGVTGSFYDGRNAFYVLIKNYPSALFARYWPRIVSRYVRTAWEAVRAWRGAAARARLRGMLTGLVRIPWLLSKRRAIQQSRRVTIAYLESILRHEAS